MDTLKASVVPLRLLLVGCILALLLAGGCASPGARIDQDSRKGRSLAYARACAPFAAMSALAYDRSHEKPEYHARMDALAQYLHDNGWRKLEDEFAPTE